HHQLVVDTSCTQEIGDPCITDADCCGIPCYEDFFGSKECNIFPPANMHSTAYTTDSACAAPDPDNCLVDADCPCSGECVTYPDETNPPTYISGNCAFPDLDQTDFAPFVDLTDLSPGTCNSMLSKCWWVRNMGKAPASKSRVIDISEGMLVYLVSPFHLPSFVLMVLESWIPYLLWPVMAAVVLSILDIIICITFFKSISEAIGGESSILGLTRAL
ncbi:MAG: hypothetical protein ABIG39_02105, partial [Candidatus Micrarchaeota archaeon]